MEKWTGYFEKLLNYEDPVEELPTTEMVPNKSFMPSTVSVGNNITDKKNKEP